MKIAVDMDNTLVDELGSSKRPGIDRFREKLAVKNVLYVWTNSTKPRAVELLRFHDLRKYFEGIIAREDYDPEEKGLPKDLRKYDFDLLIDDDPEEIIFNIGNKKRAILVEPFRKNTKPDKDELDSILKKYSS